jgi:hypothetical protein
MVILCNILGSVFRAFQLYLLAEVGLIPFFEGLHQ